MAEWSIAPVLKTDVLRGTGGSNPSLSAKRKADRNSNLFEGLSAFLFARMPAAAQGMDKVNPDQASRELAHGLDREQNKKNAAVFLFLAKEPQKGMDKVNPDQASRGLAHGLDREQNKENATAFLFLAKEPLKGMDKQSEVNPPNRAKENVKLNFGIPKRL